MKIGFKVNDWPLTAVVREFEVIAQSTSFDAVHSDCRAGGLIGIGLLSLNNPRIAKQMSFSNDSRQPVYVYDVINLRVAGGGISHF